MAGMQPIIVDDVLASARGSMAGTRIPPTMTCSSCSTVRFHSGAEGVIVDHRNLIANERVIEQALQPKRRMFSSRGCRCSTTWGSSGNASAAYRGIPLVLMSPSHFLERPVRWLQAISRHGGTISGGPDFAYRLRVDRISDAQLKGLDLSSWRVAFSGAEPVRNTHADAFSSGSRKPGSIPRRSIPATGLPRRRSLSPVERAGEGMQSKAFSGAELARGRASEAKRGNGLVSCGFVRDGHHLRIADLETGIKRATRRSARSG